MSIEYNRLRWQCRRGVTELDRLLVRFLECRYLQLTHQEQCLFAQQLLALEDDRLYAYCFTEQCPEQTELDALVQKIRATALS